MIPSSGAWTELVDPPNRAVAKACDPKIIIKRLPKGWWENPRLREYVDRKTREFEARLRKEKEKQLESTEAEVSDAPCPKTTD